MTPQSDEQVIRQVLSGDREAYGLLVDRYVAAVHAVAYARLCNPIDAEDVAQESFLKAFQSLHTLRDPSRFPAWLLTIARNICTSLIRRRGHQRVVSLGDAAEAASPAPDFERQELAGLLRSEIDRLSEKDREILLLYYFLRRDVREISDLLQISSKAAAKRLQRARKSLGERLVTRLGDSVEPLQPREESRRKIRALILAAPAPWLDGSAAAPGVKTGAGVLKGATVAVAAGLVLILGTVAVQYALPTRSSPQPAESSAVPVRPVTRTEPAVAEKSQLPDGTESRDSISPVAEAVSPATPTNEPATEPMLRGVVVDESGRPVAGAQVKLCVGYKVDETSKETEADGTFAYDSLSPSLDVYLLATAKGLNSGQQGPFVVSEERVTEARLVAYRAGSIAGHVVDEEGRPAVDCRVYAFAAGGYRFPLVEMKLDANGRFATDGLAPGRYGLGVFGADVAGFNTGDAQIQVELQPGEAVKDVRLVRASTLEISGRVVDGDGQPIGDGGIDTSGPTFGSEPLQSDGRFVLRGLKPGSYSLMAFTELGSLTVKDVAAGTSDVELRYAPRGAVEGVVVGADTGKAVERFHVWARTESTVSNPPSGEPPVHSEGQFRLDKVEAGPATLFVRAPGHAPEQVEVPEVKARETTRGIVIRLERGGVIEGMVVDPSGAPLANAYVFLGRIPQPDQRAGEADTKTDKEGRFQLDSLAPRPVELWAWHPDYAPVSAEVVPAANPAKTTVLRLTPGGSVECIVTVGGRPGPGVQVSGYYPEFQTQASWIASDAKGRCSLTHLMPGRLRVTAMLNPGVRSTAQSNRRLIREVEVVEGQNTPVAFAFAPAGGALEGHVAIAGEPVQWARMEMWIATEEGTVEEVSAEIRDGNLLQQELPAGKAVVQIQTQPSQPTYVRQTVVSIAPEGTTRLDLDLAENAGTLAIRMPEGISGARTVYVLAVEPGSDDYARFLHEIGSRLPLFSADLPGGATVRVTGLESGRYTIVVRGADDGSEPESVQTVDVNVNAQTDVMPPVR